MDKKSPTSGKQISSFVRDLLFSSLPDFSREDYIRSGGGRGKSWFENPRLIKRHRRARAAKRRAHQRCRRARGARGQNLRTGARK